MSCNKNVIAISMAVLDTYFSADRMTDHVKRNPLTSYKDSCDAIALISMFRESAAVNTRIGWF